MTLLFVYGTLKRGGSNHHYLAGQTYLGDARTLPGFKLYALDGYPGMVADVASPHGIEGEVWEVDTPTLGHLDELEGLSEGLYLRTTVRLAAPFTHAIVETYLYARNLSGRRDLGTMWPIT